MPPRTAASLPLHACRLAGLEHDAQCGVLKRPLDPAKPDGTQIDLHVVVIPALARQKLPDPIFFFAGGPGQSAIGLAGTIEHLTSRLGARRDLVLIDQRGTGHSAPLQCDVPTAEEALARALDRARAVAALDACRVALQKLPWGDLRFYTTTIAMADADAVRAALGADTDRPDRHQLRHARRARIPAGVSARTCGASSSTASRRPTWCCPTATTSTPRPRSPRCFATAPPRRPARRRIPRSRRPGRPCSPSLPQAPSTSPSPVTGEPRHVTMTREALRSLVRPGAVLADARRDAAATPSTRPRRGASSR